MRGRSLAMTKALSIFLPNREDFTSLHRHSAKILRKANEGVRMPPLAAQDGTKDHVRIHHSINL
jgi:hypothetical protein